ncbi:MAG: acetamidase/formamidase family protein [Candidatus Thermoplasmatota archaeon]|jgi:acetamidase/formamidase|nr:acetamidase/formamidase family protein [Candidatus Thermoplasmatota archaeon]
MKHLDGKDPKNIHFTWTASNKPVVFMDSDETIAISIPDSSTWQIKREYRTEDLRKIDSSRYDGAVGPIYVNGAAPGDTLEINLKEIKTAPWGWSAIIPDMGLLKGDFSEKLVMWKLEKFASSETQGFLEGISIPIHPFLGVVGTAPKDGRLGMIPPQYFGGNMDNRLLGVGSKIYLPVNVEGALLSVSDPHASQGDGEVCGTAIETSAEAVIGIRVIKGKTINYPRAYSKGPAGGDVTVTMGIAGDLKDASRLALLNMIDELSHYGLTGEESYILCSVCGNLSISEIVDEPNYVVSMSIPLQVLENRNFSP